MTDRTLLAYLLIAGMVIFAAIVYAVLTMRKRERERISQTGDYDRKPGQPKRRITKRRF